MDGPFKETDVKIAVRDKDGAIRIDTLQQLLKPANTDTGIQTDT